MTAGDGAQGEPPSSFSSLEELQRRSQRGGAKEEERRLPACSQHGHHVCTRAARRSDQPVGMWLSADVFSTSSGGSFPRIPSVGGREHSASNMVRNMGTGFCEGGVGGSQHVRTEEDAGDAGGVQHSQCG